MAHLSSVLAGAVLVIATGCGVDDLPPAPIDDDAATVDAAPPPDAAAPPDAAPDAVAVDAGPPPYPYMDLDVGCAPIFRQSIVPEYHVTIAADQWAAMTDEFLHPALDAQHLIIEPPYHPAAVHIVEGDAAYDPPNPMIRINGNTSWLQTIALDADPKMQFLISFNQVDPDGRFENLRKVKLDMPRSDWTFLHQRVALAWLRGRAGIPAQCANSGRVYINGTYYGLYANVEAQDKSFLKRVYGGEDDDGDLWKGGRIIKTNEDSYDAARISAFWHLADLAGIDGLVDLDTSMLEWASEAVIGDSDGYNQGRPNYYLYDRPSRQKFVWLATDLDTVLDEDFLEPDTTPVFAPTTPESRRHESDWRHYLTAVGDAAGVPRYVQAMSAQVPKLDPAELAHWIDDWSEQIEDAAEDDPRRPFSVPQHDFAVHEMREYPAERVAYLGRWVDCWSGGGVDADGDGFDMCHDCQDADAAQSPAAVEVCDQIDNDCDGRVDNAAGCMDDPEGAAREALWRRIHIDVKADADRLRGR